jgi:hypothetical protein
MNNNTAKTVYSSILTLKSVVKINEGESILDFLSCNYEIDFRSKKFVFDRFFVIREEHLCRMDLVCYEIYQDPSLVDLLCKWNNITNPFSIKVGDVLICPTLKALNSFYVTNPISKVDVLDTKSTWLDPSRATKKDLNRLEQLKKAAYKEKNGSTEPKPTNLLREGEVPFEANGKTIVFAPYTNPTQIQ